MGDGWGPENPQPCGGDDVELVRERIRLFTDVWETQVAAGFVTSVTLCVLGGCLYNEIRRPPPQE